MLIQLLCFGGYVNFAIVVMPNLYFTYAIKCGTMFKEEGTQLKRLTKKFIIIGGCRYYGKIYTTKEIFIMEKAHLRLLKPLRVKKQWCA